MGLAGTLASMTVYLYANTEKFIGEMDKATRKLGGLDGLGGTMAGIGKGVAVGLGGLAVAGVTGLGFAAADAMGDFVDFESGMTEVFTLLPGLTSDAKDQMTNDMLSFAQDLGVLPEEAIPALYQAISAGVPKDNVFDFLATSQAAAVGGVTDLETAVDGISSVVNAYGSDILSASDASDLMFTAVKNGKTTFGELAGSLFNVIPTAASAGIGFEQITSALATMTSQGVPTSVATTQLRQMLVELTKDGSETATMFEDIAGQSFKEFMAGGGNLADGLYKMIDATEDSGLAINDLFGSVEAGNAALAITGNGYDSFKKNLSDMGGSTGATETAFATMNDTAGRAMESLNARFDAMKLEWADKMAPALDAFLTMIADFTASPEFAAMWDGFLAATTGVITWLTENGPKIIDGIKVAFQWLEDHQAIVVGVLTALGVAMTYFGITAAIAGWTAMAPFLPAIGILLGIAAVVALLYEAWTSNFGGIQEKTAAVWDWIKNAFTTAKDFIMAFFNGDLGVISELWANTWDSISAIFSFWWETIKRIFEIFKAAFSGDWRRVGELLREQWDSWWETLKTVFGNAVENILLVVTDLWTKISGFFKNANWGEIGTNILKGIADGLVAGIKWVIDAVGAVGSAISDTFAGFFNMHSPSIKMKDEVGYQLAAGIAEGLTFGSAKLMPKAVGAVNTGLSGFGGGVAAGRGVTINVNVSGGGGDYEMARKIGDVVRRTLRSEGLV